MVGVAIKAKRLSVYVFVGKDSLSTAIAHHRASLSLPGYRLKPLAVIGFYLPLIHPAFVADYLSLHDVTHSINIKHPIPIMRSIAPAIVSFHDEHRKGP